MEAPFNNMRKRGIQEGAKGRSNFVDTDTEGFIESIRVTGVSVFQKRVEFRENVEAFFPQGQSKLSVIIDCDDHLFIY